VRLGLADELGTQSQAIEKAAAMAKVAHYKVIEIRDFVSVPNMYTPYAASSAQSGGQASTAQTREREPGVYYLYLPPTQTEQEVQP
jgi:ClpP class serine protease